VAEPDRPVRLVLTSASGDLRRRLGPTAWAVLEDVLLHGVAAGGGVVAATSERAVAARLGLARATAGRALGRLLDEGLLVRRQDRERGGTFGPAADECRLDDLDGIDRLVIPGDRTDREPKLPTSQRSTRQQPTLFPDDPDTDCRQEAKNDSTNPISAHMGTLRCPDSRISSRSGTDGAEPGQGHPGLGPLLRGRGGGNRRGLLPGPR